MRDINYYFNKAKKITGSDYKTAKALNMAPNRVSTARSKGVMSNDFCRKLAEITGDNPIDIIAAAEVKKHPETAKNWAKWVATFWTVTSGIILINQRLAEMISAELYILCSIDGMSQNKDERNTYNNIESIALAS